MSFVVVPYCRKQSCYVSSILMSPVCSLACFSSTDIVVLHWIILFEFLFHGKLLIVAVQSLNRVPVFAIPLTAACQTSLSFTVSQSLLKCMSIELVMPSNHLVLCPLSPSSPLALSLSQHQGLFQWVGISMLCNMAKKKKKIKKR